MSKGVEPCVYLVRVVLPLTEAGGPAFPEVRGQGTATQPHTRKPLHK